MEPGRLPSLLRKLSAHLQPSVAKVVQAYAEALEGSGAKDVAAATVQAAFRTKAQREALARAAELLTLLAELSDAKADISDIAATMNREANAAPAKAKGGASRTRVPTKPRPALKSADEIVVELRGVQGDRDRFPQAHGRLADSKQVSTATLLEVAHRFVGGSQTYKGRKDALAAILRRHHDVLRIAVQDQMMDQLEKGSGG